MYEHGQVRKTGTDVLRLNAGRTRLCNLWCLRMGYRSVVTPFFEVI